MNPQLVIAGVIALSAAATGFGSAWQIQSWRFDSKEKDRVAQQLTDERTASTTAIRRVEAVAGAQSAAAVRLDSLRRSAGAARDELDRLRTSSAEALRAASTSLDACVVSAATHSRLLAQCGAEYQELGERADRHTSDIRTLIQAWPR